MTPAYQSDTSSAYNSNNTTLTVTKPAGVSNGDILLFATALYTDTNVLNAIETITWPSGFTQLETTYNGTSSGKEIQLSFAWKRAGNSEGASYASSWTNGRGNKGNVVCIRYGYPVVPTQASSINKSSSDGTSAVATGLTSARDNSLFVNYGVNWVGTSWTESAGFTERITANTALWLADKVITSTGSTGNFTHTMGSSNPWIIGSVLINPSGNSPINTQPYVTVGGGMSRSERAT